MPGEALVSGKKCHGGILLIRCEVAIKDIPQETTLFTIPRDAIIYVQTSELVNKLPNVFDGPSDDEDDDSRKGILPDVPYFNKLRFWQELDPDDPTDPNLTVYSLFFE